QTLKSLLFSRPENGIRSCHKCHRKIEEVHGKKPQVTFVTSHGKTYTNGFPFANGKPFTTRVLPVLKNIAPVRTAWVTHAVEALTRSTGLITRSIDAPTRSHGLITRLAEAPTRLNSLTTRAVEAPARSHGLVARSEKIALHPFARLE
ncbi:MAG: hypothetical protein OIF58_11000, partial [Cohaesibacter sp.]|nr:hypothetical protein [Cohaesibacter sp.]